MFERVRLAQKLFREKDEKKIQRSEFHGFLAKQTMRNMSLKIINNAKKKTCFILFF